MTIQTLSNGAYIAATDGRVHLPWVAWLDLDYEFGGDGWARIALRRPKPEHLNPYQHVNAPVIYGVAEAAGMTSVAVGAGSAGPGVYTVVRSATINYQRPAHGGVTATSNLGPEATERMRQELENGRGCDIEVDVSLSDANDTPIGTCRFIVSLRPRR
jgi:acyl-coenzyme A thioesterase PaaI-like protein